MTIQAVEDITTHGVYLSPSGAVAVPGPRVEVPPSFIGLFTSYRPYVRLSSPMVTSTSAAPTAWRTGFPIWLPASAPDVPHVARFSTTWGGELWWQGLRPCQFVGETARNDTGAMENIVISESPGGEGTAPRPTTRQKLLSLADRASERAQACSARGDVEGSFYARGLRDAYRTAAMCVVFAEDGDR